jgi:tRNA pseudouridine55 synthase
MATGLLVVAVGEATKLVPYLTAATKTYEARVALGQETDTLDAAGKLTREAPVSAWPLPATLLEHAVNQELARTSQEPPAYSAIHVDGERAHAKARRGEEVTLAERHVAVRALEVIATGTADGFPFLDVRVTADKGYYVRSLGRDLARHLGTVGHLTSLRRLASGGFGVEEAQVLSASPEELRAHLIALPIAAARVLPVVRLTAAGVTEARFGRTLERGLAHEDPSAGPTAWIDEDGALIAIGSFDDGVGRVLRGFGAQ